MEGNASLKEENDYLRRVIQTQEVTNKLLQASLEEPSLTKLLELCIDHIVSVPLLPFKSKGGIFLVEGDPEVLVLKAQRGFPDYLLSACARVPFGKCLCGKAALNKDVVFAGCVDHEHEITYDGMSPHGHYCVPFLHGDEVLGVINLYVDEGHEFQEREYEFLQAIGNVISGVIVRRQTEAVLKDTQLKLVQSGKLAAIGQLAAGVAHEINNPMGFIGSNIDVLKDYTNNFLEIIAMSDTLVDSLQNGPTDETREIMQQVKKKIADSDFTYITDDIQQLLAQSKQGVERIRNIVADLKEFSSHTDEAVELIDIENLLRRVLRIAANEIESKADLKTDFGTVDKVIGDAQKLGQVFINILMNAVQAIDADGVITIRTYKERDMNCIAISDNGCGIPEENLTEVFNPFFTTKPVGQGTGLGLNICYSIINQMQGDITVESTAGQGTTFTVWIPSSPQAPENREN